MHAVFKFKGPLFGILSKFQWNSCTKKKKKKKKQKKKCGWLTKSHVLEMMGSSHTDIPYWFHPFRWLRIQKATQTRPVDLFIFFLCNWVVKRSKRIKQRKKLKQNQLEIRFLYFAGMQCFGQQNVTSIAAAIWTINNLHITCSSNELCKGFSSSFRITMLSASQRKFTPFSNRDAVNDNWLYVVNVKSFSSS